MSAKGKKQGEARRGRGSEGNTPGSETSRIVPDIDRRWHFVDLTCNAASQTSGGGANSPIPLQAGGTAKIASGSSCWIRAERGLSERPGPGGKTILSNAWRHAPQISPESIAGCHCHRYCVAFHSIYYVNLMKSAVYSCLIQRRLSVNSTMAQR